MDLSSTDHSYYFLIIAGILPFIFTGVAKYGVYSRKENREPKRFRVSLTGYRERAYAAQDNSFESFPFSALSPCPTSETKERARLHSEHETLPARGPKAILGHVFHNGDR